MRRTDADPPAPRLFTTGDFLARDHLHHPLQFAVTCAVLVVAQMVYVLFGFGSGLIAVGSLALVFPEIKDVVVLLLLVNLPAELSWSGARAAKSAGGRSPPWAWASPWASPWAPGS